MDLSSTVRCPLCTGAYDGRCWPQQTDRDSSGFDCDTCGVFQISRSALASFEGQAMSYRLRAVLLHRVRLAFDSGQQPLITTTMIESLEGESLPVPTQQARNLLRIIGDHGVETGNAYSISFSTGAQVGVQNQGALYRLRDTLIQKELVKPCQSVSRNRRGGGTLTAATYDLTLDGWERYETERRGQVAGSYGFLAMKFGDGTLDRLMSEVLKPAVSSRLNYEVVDLRDVSRAGVIDNIMRAQIRDAAFVIVDLTHDNSGAYWEAGYAEGLGKPVIYICEQEKFDSVKTHFDTNHCTTVPWRADEPEPFVESLIATLRRSLNLFANSTEGLLPG